jgi:3-phenylpropionate/cinnamic acid dioxygenase small subunit
MTDTGITAPRRPLSFSSADYDDVLAFVYTEADLLDSRRHREWLDLLTDDVVYIMPVRVTAAHSLDDSLMADMAHFDEDRYSLEKRVARFETEHAWTEDPPSRTRRFVTNVRAFPGGRDGELEVLSSVLLFRSRGDAHGPDLVSAGRTDVLRRVDGELRLARREIAVDESVLRTQNLAVFL